MGKTVRNLAIAFAVGGSIFLAGQAASAMVPELDIRSQTAMLAAVLSGGLLAGLTGRAGNRKLPTASPELRDQALRFVQEAGTGYLVILRRARSARSVGFDITLDGASAAQLMSPQFVVLPVKSGTHQLFVDIPGAPGRSGAKPSTVEVSEGEVEFFETRTAMGLTRTSVHLDPLMDSRDLRAYLARTAMVMPIN